MAASADDEIEHEFMSQPDRPPASCAASPDPWETDLVAMAADPQVQAELRDIQSEFSVTEMDGLENA